MKRMFDLTLALIAATFIALPIVFIAIAVKLTSPGPWLYWSDRVGRNNCIFKMPKFRTMKIGAPTLAKDLLQNSVDWVTPIGSSLRRYSLDEIPQLWSILKGDMSFVGPRPALFNQDDLITLRTEKGVHNLLPGLTGWAQVNGRDDISIFQKVQFDAEYLQRANTLFDIKILLMTFAKVIRGDGVIH